MEQTQLLDWDGDPYEAPNGFEDHSGGDPKPVGRLHLLSSKYGPEKDFWIYPGENIIGRLESCQICLPASSVSKAHAVIEVPIPDGPHLLYDKGSLNRTRRQRIILIPQVRYSLQDGDTLLFGDVGCQYFMLSPEAAPDSPNDSMEVPPTQTRVDASVLTIEETPMPGRKMMGFGGVLVQDSDKEEEEEDVVNGTGRNLSVPTRDGSASSGQDGTGDQSNLASSVFSSPSPTVVPESDEESRELSVSDPPCPSLRLCFECQDAESVPCENGGPPPLDKEQEAVETKATEVEATGLPGMEEVTAERQGTALSIPSLVENIHLDSDTDVEDEDGAGHMAKSSKAADLTDSDKALEMDSDTDVDEPVMMDPGAACRKNHSSIIDVSSDTDVEEEVEPIGVPKAQKTDENRDSDTDAEGGMENSSVGSDAQMEDGCKGMEKAEEDPHPAHPKGSEAGENEDSDTDVEEVNSYTEMKAKSQQSSENENSDTDVDDTSLKVENSGETLKTHEAALVDGDGDTDVEMADLVLENSDVAQPHSPHPISSKESDADLEKIPLEEAMQQDSNHLEEGNVVVAAAVGEIKNLNVQQQSSDEAVSEQSEILDEKENSEIIEKRAISPQNQSLPVLSIDSDTDMEEEEVMEIQDMASEENHKSIVAAPSGGGQGSYPENHDIGFQNSPGPIEVEDSDTDVEVVSPPHKESVAQDSDTDVEEVTVPLPGKPLEEQDTQLLVPVRSSLNGEKSTGFAMEVRVHHGPCEEDEDTDAEGNKSCSGEDSNTDDDPDLAFQTTQYFLSSEPSSPSTEMPGDTAAAVSSGNLEEEPTQDFRSPTVPARLLHGKEHKSPFKEEDSDPDAYTLEATQLFCSEPGPWQLSEEPTQAFVVKEEGHSEQTTQAVVKVSTTTGQQATSSSRDSTQPIGLPFSQPVSQTAVDKGAEEFKKEEETRSVQPVQSLTVGSSQPLTLQEVKREQVCTAIPEGGSITGPSQTQSEADGELEERSSVPVREARDIEQVPEHSEEDPSPLKTSASGKQYNLRCFSAASPAPVPQGRSLRHRGHVESGNTERSEEPAAPVSRRRGLRQLSNAALHMGELEGKTEQSKEEEVSPHKKLKNGAPAIATRQGRARYLQREAVATDKLKGEMEATAGSPGTRELTRQEKQRTATQSVEEQQPELPRTRSKRWSNSSDSPAQSTPSSGRRLRSQSTESKPVEMRYPPRNQSQASSVHAPKVLFTGVIDEEGERVVTELGGSLAESVFDCTHLVTDRVRRTVKFLCALAQGIPIVTLDWLEKSRQNSFFLAPNSFLVRDPEQEKNFQFSLTTSLRIAQQEGGLFQGYEIHVTPNVKPEPEHMRDIVKCSGGTFLPRMPRAYKEKRIVVSCPDDLPRCKPAQDAKVPIANSEFILTGILQQKINLEAHRLDEVRTSLPASPVVPITRASKRRAVAQTAPTPPTTAKRRH
ncbi:mediator of DNA damage checkpoint protein 1 isoform X2 [Sceloporus undulatus]|uniref:mediator of DNA damage checkpoint protein 1 isoform X2 n=1 Tax=Sceloporus undulatus TaxID=8520 RepID=UPI001C4B79FB|nr:mediator of DNA damage checkpoint protein 1 isoform X2 [Sceloporus undulatus]